MKKKMEQIQANNKLNYECALNIIRIKLIYMNAWITFFLN